MNRKIQLILFILLAAAVPGICSENPESGAAGQNPVFAQFKEISVACPIGAPPYSYKDNDGEAKGSVIEIWRLWSEKTGIRIRFISGVWGKTVDDVCGGTADVHAAFDEPDHPCLEQIVPTADFNEALFWSEGLSGVKGMEDLSGIRIGIIKGTLEESYMKQHYPNADLMLYPSLPAMIESARKREIKAMIAIEESVIWWLKKQQILSKFQFIPKQPVIKIRLMHL